MNMNSFRLSLFFIPVFLIFLSPGIYSQQNSNIIKTNTLGLLLGNFNASYEKVMNVKSSFVLSGSFLSSATIISSDISALGLGLAYRYYLTHSRKASPVGLWAAPRVSFVFGGTVSSSSNRSEFNLFSSGAETGYQWLLKRRITVEPGIGASYSVMRETQDGRWISRGGTLLPVFIIAVGYAF